jgi:iron(III) transport system ATP-binding protein
MAIQESDSRAGGGQPFLRLERITKKFGDFTALQDISLEVEAGEFVVFLGPSGCGKTTLLRIIAGLEIQTGGLIYQSGHEISALPPAKRDFGIVFQSYALFPNLSVFDNTAYGLKSEGFGKKALTARVAELLDMVGLPDEAHKYPAQLSGGQQQRIAVARAIATSPGLLLLDEPLSALDARVRVHLRHELKRLQRRLGITSVMVTHDQAEALTMADRIVVMNHGVIEQIGTPRQVYRNPTTPFVADFIGTMNFLTATVVGSESVRLGGLDIACAVDGLTEGQAVSVAVRSEDVLLSEGRGTANSFTARIVDLDFVGSYYRVVLATEVLGEVTLTADFPVNAVRGVRMEPGAELSISVPKDALHVFPAA